ncbi:aromatic amino acid transporter [Castellaniella sp. WN]
MEKNRASPAPGGKAPSVIGGVMIVAGTVIGAGMLALPIVSAGMWTGWTLMVLAASFFLMLSSALMILRTNVRFGPGASFDTLVRGTLGPVWNVVNGVSVGFVLYMLMYAYTSGGGATLKHSLGLPLPQGIISLCFALTLAFCIFWSTRAVDRLSVILVVGMVATFVVAVAGMLPAFQFENLWLPVPAASAGTAGTASAWFILAALPYFLTSFCFHASVPSLVKYYGTDVRRIKACILYGLLIAAAFYALWILAGFGVLGREALRDVYAQGGNISHFLAEVDKIMPGAWVGRFVSIFAFLAVVTSFLGAGLGLFDYIADVFGFDDTPQGRIKTAIITFLPPVLGGVMFPDGFIIAIGFAGFAAAVWSVVIPAAMEWKSLRGAAGQPNPSRPAGAGLGLVRIVWLYGVVTAMFHLLSPDVLDVLPVYR